MLLMWRLLINIIFLHFHRGAQFVKQSACLHPARLLSSLLRYRWDSIGKSTYVWCCWRIYSIFLPCHNINTNIIFQPSISLHFHNYYSYQLIIAPLFSLASSYTSFALSLHRKQFLIDQNEFWTNSKFSFHLLEFIFDTSNDDVVLIVTFQLLIYDLYIE